MKGFFAVSRILSLLFVLALRVVVAGAQTVPPLDKIQNQQELDKAIATLDAALFDSYNRCDLGNSVISLSMTLSFTTTRAG